MTCRAVDENHDMMLGHSISNYKSNVDELKQRLLTRLLCWRGNCFWDDEGVDWVNIIGSFNTKDYAKEEIMRVVNNTPGVRKIEKLDLVLNNKRQLTVSLIINTIYGDLQLSFTQNGEDNVKLG